MNPLFSVVVVNYEQTHLLKACLTSIFDQIYDNIELIICDDASCDFDLQEIEAYIEKVKSGNIKNVVVFQQDRFKGFSASCQKGFELARGEYIKYLTPEDSFIDNSVISRAQKLFVEFGADVLATNLALTNPATGTATEQAIFHYEGSCVNPAVAFENLATQDDESFIFSQSAFLKRETIEKAGGFDLRYEQVAFWPLWLKAALGGGSFLLLKSENDHPHGVCCSNVSAAAYGGRGGRKEQRAFRDTGNVC